MAFDPTRTAPNRKVNNGPTTDWGKSRTAFWEGEATTPRTREIKFTYITENFSIPLPANTRVHGEAVIFNNGGSAVTVDIGTAAAGTQVLDGAAVAADTTSIQAVTDTGVTRTDRTLYFTSAAWGTETHVVLQVTEYPPVPDTSALS